MTQVQTLASGPTVAQNFGNWGTVPQGGTSSAPAPHRAFCLIMSDEGKGKSFLASDIPGALMLNFDLTGYATKRRAQVLPVLNQDGIVTVANGSKFKWTLEYLDKFRNELVQAAQNNQPRPSTIVIDSLNSLLRTYLNHYGDKIAMSDYADVYDGVREFCLTLRDAGYGVWVLSHFQMVKVKARDAKIGDPPLLERQVSHPDKLHLRLHPFVEYCGEIIIEKRTREERKPRLVMVNGKEVQSGIETKVVTDDIRFITFDPSRYDKILKSRVQFPDGRVELSSEHPYDSLYNAYLTSISTPTPSVT